MELERVEVLVFVGPSSFTTRDVLSKVVKENRAIYNCVPVQSNDWEESTKSMLRHWLTSAKDQVWFCRVQNNEGMLFFRDPKQRIINVKTMLADLFLAQKHSFVYQKMEKRQLEKLMSIWEDLHELKINYAEFLDPKTNDPVNGELKAASEMSLEPVAMDLNFDNNSYKYYPGPEPVFVYGKVHPVQIASLDKVPFTHLLKAMTPMKNLAFPLHVWSQIIGGGSAIAIPSSADRYYIFEPVLFHYIQQTISKRHAQSGPIAVVLCDTRATAENVANYFVSFNAGFTTHVRVSSLLNANEMDEEEVYSLINCDILLITLSSMLSLLSTKIDGYGLLSVEILVVHNSHNMANTEGCIPLEEAKPWANFWQVLQFFRPQKKQTIVVTLAWKPIFKKVFECLNEPIICFGSPVEVALKENSDMVLKMAYNEEGQIAHLIEIVNQSMEDKKCTGVVFSSAEAMTSAQRELKRLNIPFYALGDAPHRPTSLYLMTDQNIQNMILDPVDVLVHFSMPKWAFFTTRFVLLAKNFESKLPTKTFILLNLAHSDKFLGALKPLSVRTKSDVFGICEELKRRKDQFPENLRRQFCKTLALNGDCPDKFTCSYRHSLNESDVPASWMPVGNQVELNIVLVKAPNHFRAEVVSALGESATLRRDRLRVKLSLDLLFSDEANRKTKTAFSVGELCLFHVGQYRRGRIIAMKLNLSLVTVQCLETGNEFSLCTKIDTICELPENLQAIPPQVIDIYLAGILPMDADSGWCPHSIQKLKIKLENCRGNKFIAVGKIGVTMNNVIYLTEMKVHEILASSGVRIIAVDVKEYLLQFNYAKPWEKGINGLLKIAQDFDLKSKIILMPKEMKEERSADKPVKVQSNEEPMKSEEPIGVEIQNEELVKRVEDVEVDQQQEQELQGEDIYELISEGEEENLWEDDNDETFQYQDMDVDDEKTVQYEDSDFDCNFDDDDLADFRAAFFNMPANPIPPVIGQFPEATIEEIDEEEDEEEMVVTKDDPKQESVAVPRPLWQSEFKQPEILWSQSDKEIKLRVSAPDVVNYEMDVGPEDLDLVLELPDEEPRRVLLNFFGAIDTEGVTASMRGLVLVITMPKFLPGSKFNWPRLLLTTQYFRWLKYYDNLVEDDEQEFLIVHPFKEMAISADMPEPQVKTVDFEELS